jgi:hypothetical protein
LGLPKIINSKYKNPAERTGLLFAGEIFPAGSKFFGISGRQQTIEATGVEKFWTKAHSLKSNRSGY